MISEFERASESSEINPSSPQIQDSFVHSLCNHLQRRGLEPGTGYSMGPGTQDRPVALELLFIPRLIHPGRERIVPDEAGIPSVAAPSFTKPVLSSMNQDYNPRRVLNIVRGTH